MKRYNGKNKEKLKSSTYKWREKNYGRWKENSNRWAKNQYKINLNYKIACLLRKRIRGAINEHLKIGKLKKSIEYGINYSQIISHLLDTFPEDYYIKKYHIDHIHPLCSFDLENPEEIKKVCAPDNHQWLTAKENMKKAKQDKLQSIRCK